MAGVKGKSGGAREGAGRPAGTSRGSRPQHQIRANDEEWEIIRRFAKLVKHGEMESCVKALEQIENKIG